MFPRLALRAGAASSLFRGHASNRVLVAVSSRGAMSVRERAEQWEKANQTYYGPERDQKNFPIAKQPETTPPVKFGFIPKSWFDALYEKTGVTGPYMFGIGALTYMWSKEIWIMDSHFIEVITFVLPFWWVTRKFGPRLSEFLSKQREEYLEARWHGPIRQSKEECTADVKEMEKSIWQMDGQSHLFDAKRENVDLQLEAVYRKRLSEVHQAVKKRLDYQLEVETITRAYQQQHMVNWIVRNVVKGITPQQEKESITKCIQDLKVLAQKQQATA